MCEDLRANICTSLVILQDRSCLHVMILMQKSLEFAVLQVLQIYLFVCFVSSHTCFSRFTGPYIVACPI